MPKEKIIPGIPTFGLSFQLENENRYQIGNKITAPGFPGRVTDRAGLLSAYEVYQIFLREIFEIRVSHF